MKDSEKMAAVIDDTLTFEQMVYRYMRMYHKEFSATRINDMIKTLNDMYLTPTIASNEHAISISKERALYLKTYLSGDMYTTEEAAIKHLPLQLGHAEEIYKQCSGKGEQF